MFGPAWSFANSSARFVASASSATQSLSVAARMPASFLFFPDQWSLANAPRQYLPACAGASPCSGDDRQAKDPRTGALLGPGTSSLVGQVVMGTGSAANGMVPAGHGIASTGYLWPWLGLAPRLGVAYDPSGRKRVVLRGSLGLFFDRPDGNTMFNTVANPPVATGLTQQWGNLADLANSPVPIWPVPTVRVYYYNSKLPSDAQWNGGAQIALPWSSSIDVSYVGRHAYNVLGAQQAANPVDLNTIDVGTTLTAAGQDPTQASGTALPNNLLRSYRGYCNIQIQWGRFIGPSTPFRPHSSGDGATASRRASTGRTP